MIPTHTSTRPCRDLRFHGEYSFKKNHYKNATAIMILTCKIRQFKKNIFNQISDG